MNLVTGRSVGTAKQTATETLADDVGIEPSYRDTEGHIRHISLESKRGVLQSMGFDLCSENAIHAALHQWEEVDWHRLVAPVTVLRRSRGAVPSVTVTLPDALLSQSMDWCVAPEGCSRFFGTLVPESLDVLEHHTVRCGTFVRIRLPLPMELNDGYHQVTLAIAGVEAATTLVITPPKAFVPDWVERGERLTVTVDRRPVAQIVPLRRRRAVPTAEALAIVSRHAADRGLLEDVRGLLSDTTDDL